VALSRVGANVTLTINGTVAGTLTAATGGLSSSGPIALVGQFGLSAPNTFDATRAFDGRIDEMRLWTPARSLGQIRALMRTTLVGNEAGLRAYWRLDAGTGQTALDSTGTFVGGLGTTPGAEPTDPTWVISTAPLSGQRDNDADGQGNVCDSCPDDPSNDVDLDGVCAGLGFFAPAIGDSDNCPMIANANQLDTDLDGRGNVCDNCPNDANASQADADGDGIGNVCDNSPLPNPSQLDLDEDGVGDVSDEDDRLLYLMFANATVLGWGAEPSFTAFNVYAGDLDTLQNGGAYTQDPGSNPLAGRYCALAGPALEDTVLPSPGKTRFYLATGVDAQGEQTLGSDSAGLPRPNTHPCP